MINEHPEQHVHSARGCSSPGWNVQLWLSLLPVPSAHLAGFIEITTNKGKLRVQEEVRNVSLRFYLSNNGLGKAESPTRGAEVRIVSLRSGVT